MPRELAELGYYTTAVWRQLVTLRAKLSYLANVEYDLRARALLNPNYKMGLSQGALELDLDIVDRLLDKVANRTCRYQVIGTGTPYTYTIQGLLEAVILYHERDS
jgi:hypothetical protein